jgi:hypothetical protein
MFTALWRDGDCDCRGAYLEVVGALGQLQRTLSNSEGTSHAATAQKAALGGLRRRKVLNVSVSVGGRSRGRRRRPRLRGAEEGGVVNQKVIVCEW